MEAKMLLVCIEEGWARPLCWSLWISHEGTLSWRGLLWSFEQVHEEETFCLLWALWEIYFTSKTKAWVVCPFVKKTGFPTILTSKFFLAFSLGFKYYGIFSQNHPNHLYVHLSLFSFLPQTEAVSSPHQTCAEVIASLVSKAISQANLFFVDDQF